MSSQATGGIVSKDARLAEYTHVTEQFRNLTEIRFRLLGLLPLGTIGTLGIVGSQKQLDDILAPLAVFGFVVTLALFLYHLRNDQHYDELISRGAQIERSLGLLEGSFAQRPARWHRLGFGIYVEHRRPINLVYTSSAAVWLWALRVSKG